LNIKNINLSKWDNLAVLGLISFVIIMSILVYTPKGDCEVARPGYKCASASEVMVENCEYWGKYDCDSSSDVSLPQVEWYIGNLCKIANRDHNYGYDCAGLKHACNQVVEKQVCPVNI